MRHLGNRHVRTMRALLNDANQENSRMVAAAIGGHLAKLTNGRNHDALDAATNMVRETSLRLLRSVHLDAGVEEARRRALRSVDLLDATLPGPAFPEHETRRAPARRLSFLRRLTPQAVLARS